MSQPEGQCHKGTSKVSQMIWMEDRIRDLEDRLYAAEASNENLKGAYRHIMQKLDRKIVDCNEARKLAENLRDELQSQNACIFDVLPGQLCPWEKEDEPK